MNRLEKIERDMEKAQEKIAEWQNRMKELDGQRKEQGNLQIVQAVRALKLTRDELAAFISGGTLPQSLPGADAVPAARYSRRKPETADYETTDITTNFESEDKSHEEELQIFAPVYQACRRAYAYGGFFCDGVRLHRRNSGGNPAAAGNG